MSSDLTNTQKAGRILRLLAWINLVLIVLLTLSIGIPALAGQVETPGIIIVVFVLMLAVLWAQFAIGAALKRHEGRAFGLGLAILMLFSFPVGTILGAVVIVYLAKGWSEPPLGRFP